jgi:23S rRNA (uracil1939-C5)-methyltransferase
VEVVRDLSSDGRGVIEAPDGQILFVSGVWPGEEVEIKRSRRGKSVVAELRSILTPSTARRDPVCVHHQQGSCGGCPWMFVDYQEQLQQKQSRLSKIARRIAFTEQTCLVREAPQSLGYRNRAQLKSDGVKLGYVAKGSHGLADVTECPVLTDVNQRQLATLRKTLPNRDWRPSKHQQWTTLDIDDERGTPLINQRQAFRQGNSDQNKQLRKWLSAKLASLLMPGSVFEFFCGSGNLTELISQQIKSPVIAVEADALSIDQLTARALPNVRPLRVNLFSEPSITSHLPVAEHEIGIVMDPPRDGLKERDALAAWFMRAQWVVYVSCDAATWERDAMFMQACGLFADDVSGLDMFPHTPHIEILSVFKRESR